MSGFSKKLSDEDYENVRSLSSYRVPMPVIAQILGISESTLYRMAKADDKLRDSLESGRAIGTANVYQTAFQAATSGKHLHFTRFWLQAQEKWTTTERIELKDGGAEKTVDDMTPAERQERIDKLLDLRAKIIDVTPSKAKHLNAKEETSDD